METNQRAVRRQIVLAPAVLSAVALALSACGGDERSTEIGIDGALALPSDWAGEWDLEITFRDPASGATVATERIVDCLAAGESLVQPLVPSLANCVGTVRGDRLEVACSSSLEDGGCRLDVQLELSVDLVDDRMLGAGSWTVDVAGSCGGISGGGEDIEIAGTRLGPAPADCGGAGAVVAERWPERTLGLLR